MCVCVCVHARARLCMCVCVFCMIIWCLEDDGHTVPPRTGRTERGIQEVATLVCVNHSKMIDKVTAAPRISNGTCHRIESD
jgi:hypothetical protein